MEINTTSYFFKNFQKNKLPYYDKLIKNVEEFINYPSAFIDDKDIIKYWKKYVYPSNNVEDKATIFDFASLSFYLYNEGYEITDHPNLLYKIASSKEVSDEELKEATRNKYGTDYKGHVTWASRRKYIDSLNFIKKEGFIPYSDTISNIFKKVSSRSANFNDMPIDEKLAEIRNAFANIGKMENGKYIKINFEQITDGLLTEKDVINYQNKLQCFRHGEEAILAERSKYNNNQKMFLIDYGLMILNITERYVIEINKKN